MEPAVVVVNALVCVGAVVDVWVDVVRAGARAGMVVTHAVGEEAIA